MSRVQPRVLKGFRDYLPDVMFERDRMLRAVADVFQSFGFAPLATPALEYTEVLLGKYGDEGEKLLYRFEDNGGRDVSLRYDLTVPLARVIGQHGQLDKPFRRYQIAPVWRAEKPARGRFREFMQCDVDVVGSDSLIADFECIQVGVAVLRALGVDDFAIRVNDRRVLDGLLEKVGQRERAADVLRVVDKLPKVGWDAVAAELEQAVGVSGEARETIRRFLEASLSEVDDSMVDMDVASSGIESLNQLLAWSEELDIGGFVAVDLSIARGLDYYTSTIYETFLGALPGLGSVMSGGRYDTLLSMFTRDAIPAVGISLGVDRLLAGLGELGLLGAEKNAPDVYVLGFDQETVGYAQRVAAALRRAGLSAVLSLKPGQKLGKQFKAADKAGSPWVAIVGTREAESGTVTLKTMATGEQRSVPFDELAAIPRTTE